jgi:hypothetical protein
MQLAIFDLPSTSAENDNDSEINGDATNDPRPAIVAAYERIWSDYGTILASYQDSIRQLWSLETKAHRMESFCHAVRVPADFKIQQWQEELASRIEEGLAAYAGKFFAAKGFTIAISVDELRKDSRPHRYGERPPFSVSKFWQVLETTYGDGKGSALAWYQTARTLSDKFLLERSDSIERKAGYVVLNLDVRLEKERNADGSGRYVYWCAESIAATLQALASFCHWAGRAELAQLLDGESGEWYWTRPIHSKERFSFGANSDVVITTFFNRLEFRFKSTLAQSLQLFLAQHRGMEA